MATIAANERASSNKQTTVTATIEGDRQVITNRQAATDGTTEVLSRQRKLAIAAGIFPHTCSTKNARRR